MNSLRAFIFLASSFCIHCGQSGAAEGLSLLSLDKKQGWEASCVCTCWNLPFSSPGADAVLASDT